MSVNLKPNTPDADPSNSLGNRMANFYKHLLLQIKFLSVCHIKLAGAGSIALFFVGPSGIIALLFCYVSVIFHPVIFSDSFTTYLLYLTSTCNGVKLSL